MEYEDDDLSRARKKVKRLVEVPKKLGFEEMATYGLLVENDIIDLDPSSNVEATECKDSKSGLGRWKKKFNLF